MLRRPERDTVPALAVGVRTASSVGEATLDHSLGGAAVVDVHLRQRVKVAAALVSALGVAFTQPPTEMGPVSTAGLDDTCGNLIQIAAM